MPRKRKSRAGPYLLHAELLRERIPNPASYPYNLPAIRHLGKLLFHPKVTFLVGENGSGKSTLLEAVAVEYGLNPEGGSKNFNFATQASHSILHQAFRLARTPGVPGDAYFFRAESFYNVASEIDRLGYGIHKFYGGRSLHAQSHGESFFALFEHRFGNHGLYLMDEPEAALSPKRQVQFLGLLHDRVRAGAQFVIATHSPIIMAYPDALIYHLSENAIRAVGYTETEHYLITRGFLANPKRTLDVLMDDTPGREGSLG